jgi:hypothetical protein
MRIYDTEIKIQTDNGSIEITEYHDERHGTIGPRRWHARIILVEDGGIDVVNLNRPTQTELHQALVSIRDTFEAATTAVLDAATVS